MRQEFLKSKDLDLIYRSPKSPANGILHAKFNFNTGINGGNRAIVPVGSYEEIIPHDILMTQLLKALVVGDVEVAAELGMFELTAEDLALATYVCPSKYDYCSILMDNLNKVYEEL